MAGNWSLKDYLFNEQMRSAQLTEANRAYNLKGDQKDRIMRNC